MFGEYRNLLIEIQDGIGIVTLNRPEALNAVNFELLEELSMVCGKWTDDQDIKIIFIIGSGEKSFSVGWDINSVKLPMTVSEGRRWSARGQAVFNQLGNLPQPVIAVINGYALGVGCELAMACDIRIASDKAKFSQPEPFIGMTPGFGGTQRLARLVGAGRAKELLFTAEAIDAPEAYRIGLINKCVPQETLMNVSMAMAKKIMSHSPIAVRLCKTAVNTGYNADMSTALNYERELFASCFDTEDVAEGVRAFREKRKANFSGK